MDWLCGPGQVMEPLGLQSPGEAGKELSVLSTVARANLGPHVPLPT